MVGDPGRDLLLAASRSGIAIPELTCLEASKMEYTDCTKHASKKEPV